MQRYLGSIDLLAQKTAGNLHRAFETALLQKFAEKAKGENPEAQAIAGYLSRWRQRAKISAWACTGAGAIALALASFSSGSMERLILSHLAIGGAAIASQQRRSAEEIAPVLGVVARLQAYNSVLPLVQVIGGRSPAITTEAIALPDSLAAPQFFDWEDLKDGDRYPHIGVAGATGDGKTTVATFITQKSGGTVVAIDPHYRPGNYSHCMAIHAKGRNYGNWDDSLAGDLSALLDGNMDYCSVLKSLEEEMDRRYKLYEVGEVNFDRLEVILDEFNTFIEANPGALECYLKLLREARKVGIRLLFLLQSDLAKDMKLEGRTSARKCLKWLRLGEFAQNYARSLKDEAAIAVVGSQAYPMMMEKQPAKLP